jgi:hypothetical protein
MTRAHAKIFRNFRYASADWVDDRLGSESVTTFATSGGRTCFDSGRRGGLFCGGDVLGHCARPTLPAITKSNRLGISLWRTMRC